MKYQTPWGYKSTDDLKILIMNELSGGGAISSSDIAERINAPVKKVASILLKMGKTEEGFSRKADHDRKEVLYYFTFPKFRPCPFCGDIPTIDNVEKQLSNDYRVVCNKCRSVGRIGNSREESIVLWNKRFGEEYVDPDD